MSSSCSELRDALAQCVKGSDCMKNGRKFHDCLAATKNAHENEVPESCKRMRLLYVECKRGQVDMRLRFSGNRAYERPEIIAAAEEGADEQNSTTSSS